MAFLVLVLLFYFFMVLSTKSRMLRKLLSGRPTVLIEKGKLLDNNMKKVKFTIDDLNQYLREKDIFNITEVEYALLEVSGQLSVLKKDPLKNITKQDLNLPYSREDLPIELIMDGVVIHKNAVDPYNQKWIEAECKKRNVQIEDVYYAVLNSQGSLFVDLYKDKILSPTDVELTEETHYSSILFLNVLESIVYNDINCIMKCFLGFRNVFGLVREKTHSSCCATEG